MKHEQIIEIELAQIGFALALILKVASNASPKMMMSERIYYSSEAGGIIKQLNEVVAEIGKRRESEVNNGNDR